MAPQAARGVIVDDFTAGDAQRIWSELALLEPQRKLVDPPLRWKTSDKGPPGISSFDTRRGREGDIVAQATYSTLTLFLRSNWGPLVAGAFELKTQINEWMTLAWVEDKFNPASSTKRLVRHRDAWVHRLTMRIVSTGKITLQAEYAARATLDTSLDAPGPVVLPTAPIGPTDQNVFAGRSAQLFRDPLGDNERITFERLEIIISQGLGATWRKMGGWEIWKVGEALVDLVFPTRAADAGWEIIDRTNAETRQRYRLIATAPNPARTLTMDFFDVNFVADDRLIGHEARQARGFELRGRPHVDLSGKFVDISLV